MNTNDGSRDILSMQAKERQSTLITPGMNNTKFSKMVEDALAKYKIPHYGDLAHSLHFEVIRPCLISNKYVAY
jgi:hypothetical protein